MPWSGTAVADAFDFTLPPELEAREPPEARGLPRDAVRLLVSRLADDGIAHARFRDLPRFLAAGDVIVVNASATLPAAIDALRLDAGGIGERVVLHFSSPVPFGGRAPHAQLRPRARDPVHAARWVVELRRDGAKGAAPLLDAAAGERLLLDGGGAGTLIEPFRSIAGRGTRLWVAELSGADDVPALLARRGRPIRYGYLRAAWPLPCYQTMFATEPGSAEMPSAGRAFTPYVVRRLAAEGVRVVPIVLHTGVASLEADEPPYPERYRVPAASATAIEGARARGGRVVAAGTTVVRALETAAAGDGAVRASAGWTDLVVTPERGLVVVDALLTGFHEPRASHLDMLEALAGRAHIARAYEAALRAGYLWHEFGDLHLILP